MLSTKRVVVVLLALAAPALAQVEIELQVPGDGPAADGVYVQDSTAALDRFALAERLVSLGEFGRAAEVYQEATDDLGRQLVAARSTDDGEVYQYRPVSLAVRERLAAWPIAGRDAYRDRYAAEADRLLEEAQDDAALADVVERFFLTEAAADAARTLVDRRLAEGDFLAAAGLAETMLDGHPDLASIDLDGTPARAGLLLRAALARHLAGDADLAAERADALRTEFPDAAGAVAGERRNLAEAAATVLAEAVPPRDAPPAGRWPTLGGDDDRSRLADVSPGTLAPMFVVEHADLDPPGGQTGRRPRRGTQHLYAGARQLGQMAGVFPAVADGLAYWTDNARVYAINLDSRLPPPAWLATHPAGEDATAGAYAVAGQAWQTPRGAALAPALDGDRLYALLARPDDRLDAEAGNPSTAQPQLVALDRRDGRELWKATARDAAEAEGLSQEVVEALAASQFVGNPVVAGGTVWNLAKTDPQRGGQFEQTHLVGLDADTGDLRHATYLATASQDRLRYHQRAMLPEPDPLLSASGGTVYAPTGRGALAAVSAADGRVRWINLYGRIPAEQRAGVDRLRNRRRGTAVAGGGAAGSRATPALPFHVSAPIVEDNRVFYRPPDAEAILIYDAADGRRLARVPVEPPEDVLGRDPVRTLLAVEGDRLFAFGGDTAFCLKWPNLVEADAAGAFDLLQATDWCYWTAKYTPAPDGAGRDRGGVESILGRPAVTRTHVLVPTIDGLAAVRIDTGAWDDTRLGEARRWASLPPGEPYGGAGDDARQPPTAQDVAGNVIAVDERVVVAGQRSLAVLADRSAVRTRLEARRKEDPGDPAPVLTLAEVEGVAGEWRAAAGLLREAADLPGGRDAAFETALNLARSQRQPGASASLLRLAEDLATRPRQHVRARLSSARRPDPLGGDAERVAALQEILAEPSWRDVPVDDGQGPAGRRTAGDLARERIAGIVADVGPGPYAEVEDAARAALDDAGDDPDALRRVADVYPNSNAAAEALARLKDAALEAGRSDLARRALRESLAHARGRGDATAPPRLEAEIARLDAADPRGLPAAAARMRRVARLFPTAPAPELTLADGEVLPRVPAADLAQDLTARVLAAEEDRLPAADVPADAALPPFEAEPAATVRDVAAIVPQAGGMARNDRVLLARDDGTVTAHRFGVGEPAATYDFAADAAGWLGDDVVLWGQGGAARFGPDGGRRWLWTPADLSGDGAAIEAVAVMSDRPDDGESADAPAEELARALADARPRARDAENADLVRRAFEAARAAGRGGRLELADPRGGGDALRFAVPEAELQLMLAPGRVVVQDGRRDRNVVESLVAAPRPRTRDAAGPVRIAAPARDGLAVSTADGRLAFVGFDGEARWSRRLGVGKAGGAVALSVAGDHAAVRVDSPDGPAVVAYDLDTGRPGAWRAFPVAGPDELMNFAVLSTNELAVVTPGAVEVIDLDDHPGRRRGGARLRTSLDSPTAFVAAGVDPRRELAGARGRWLGGAAGGRIHEVGGDLVVYADPRDAGRRDAVVIDLDDGDPLRIDGDDDASRQAAATLGGPPVAALRVDDDPEAGAIDPAMLPEAARRRAEVEVDGLRDRLAGQDLFDDLRADDAPAERAWAVGPHVYLTARRGVAGHDLSRPDGTVGPHWTRPDYPRYFGDPETPAAVVDALPTRGHLLVIEAIGGEERSLRVVPFSRATVEGGGYESGLMGVAAELPGASDVAAMDGGVAVLEESGTVAFRRGTGG